MKDVKVVNVNGVDYVPKDSVKSSVPAEKVKGLERVVIRSYGAGVFYGYLKEKKAELNGVNVILLRAKRIHHWKGACSLTQLAMEGVKNPQECRITDAIDSEFIANVIEILPLTKDAEKNLDGVELWKK